MDGYTSQTVAVSGSLSSPVYSEVTVHTFMLVIEACNALYRFSVLLTFNPLLLPLFLVYAHEF